MGDVDTRAKFSAVLVKAQIAFNEKLWNGMILNLFFRSSLADLTYFDILFIV